MQDSLSLVSFTCAGKEYYSYYYYVLLKCVMPSVHWHCLLGDRKCIPPVKTCFNLAGIWLTQLYLENAYVCFVTFRVLFKSFRVESGHFLLLLE